MKRNVSVQCAHFGRAPVFFFSRQRVHSLNHPIHCFYLICAYILPRLGLTTRNRLVQENAGGNVTHLRYNVDEALERVFQACPTHPGRSII